MFLRALLKENIPLAQMILQIIMQKPDLRIISCTSQADFKRVTGARSICLDAYAQTVQAKSMTLKYNAQTAMLTYTVPAIMPA